jgi:hypothetical protein
LPGLIRPTSCILSLFPIAMRVLPSLIIPSLRSVFVS